MTEVLVIGGGNAALCAALSARRLGASVTVIERAPAATRGGNSKYTRNLRCVHNAGDRQMPGVYTEDELLADIEEISDPGTDAELTRLVVRSSRELPSWMEEQGARWQPALEGTLQLGRTNRFFLGGGKALLNTYYRTAERLGVRFRYGTTATGFVFDDNRCVGVEVRNGTVETLRPDAIVVASGGYEANRDWLEKIWGEAARNYAIRGCRENDGLPLEALLAAGAQPKGPERGFHATAVDARSPSFDGGIATRVDAIPFGIVVDRDGKRFADEGEDLWPKRYATWGQLIARQDDQIAHVLFDSKVAGTFIASIWPPHSGNTLEDLARAAGLPADRLAATVSRYNAATRPGSYATDRLDGCATIGLTPPKSNWALPIDTPPYFAYPVRPGITFTYLGLAVDAAARVRRIDGGSFENVFAAGEVMAGNVLNRGYLAGLGMTIGTVFGRVAGKEAASAGA